MNKLVIKNNREYRFIKKILTSPTTTHDLRAICGAEHVPGVRYSLYHRGWEVITHFQRLIDRDGKKVSIGVYSIAEHQHESAKQALIDWEQKQKETMQGVDYERIPA